MMVSHTIDGKEYAEPAAAFPVDRLPRGTQVRVSVYVGGVWPVIIEQAHQDYIKTEGGSQFEISEVETLYMHW